MSAYRSDEIMLMLQAISPDVSVLFSEYTRQWYVSARRLEVGNGMMLTGTAEHRDTVEQAVQAIFERLTNTAMDEYVVGEYLGQRREYRWNGATFAEVTRPLVIEQQSSTSGGAA